MRQGMDIGPCRMFGGVMVALTIEYDQRSGIMLAQTIRHMHSYKCPSLSHSIRIDVGRT
jgi:hypothetical protein